MNSIGDIASASMQHPKPVGIKFSYGTAGFRMGADLLDSVVFRIGLSAALRSRKLNGQTVGVMITASHNPSSDNGVKLVDPQGGMLETNWETFVVSLANAENEQVQSEIERIVKVAKVDMNGGMNVIYARDTRPSGEKLSKCLQDALSAIGATTTDYGVKTTPQLHYLVRALNTVGTVSPYGEPTEIGYYQKLSGAFKQLVKEKQRGSAVHVDCANGVGGPKLQKLLKYLEETLDLIVTHDDVTNWDNLNRQCGADFVKTFQKPPPGTRLVPFQRYASLDGDADRIVYYYAGQDGCFRLLDGDKIAGLAAVFFQELVKCAGIDLKIGVVQTAYANGNSTNYLSKTLEKKLPVTCVATGVKHLHHAAQRYDIGIYFEANGHGTVLFSPTALALLESHEASSPAQHSALESLRGLSNLINQTVGDALSDLLLVEAILAIKGWGPSEWDSAYTDLPNRLFKKTVKDRSLFVTTDAERKLVKPEGLQDKIDELVAKYSDGRAFVRASGTEDLVRIYAEAKTRSEADDLGMRIMALVS